MRYFTYLLLAIIVSLYYFPIGLTILPANLNTKNILAASGIIFLLYDAVQYKKFTISMPLFGAIAIAVIFSLICFYSTDFNHTSDYAYATYFVSFAVWIFGAYAVCAMIKIVHGHVNFKILTLYLTAVCFGQCIAALLIDRVVPIQLFVNAYVNQGQEFLEEVNRLYGIGASLDTAGVRFSIVLVMIATLLSTENSINRHFGKTCLLLTAFFIITVIGNMMARTTIIGLTIALLYFALSTFKQRLSYEKSNSTVFYAFLLVGFFIISISIFLYQTDDSFYKNMRFAFEGFFNWIEKGEWRTDSTDKLNREMWVWPKDNDTWVIGSGLFDNFIYSTDIGYCRFILYCGIVGFSTFALFFIYNAFILAKQNSRYALMFFCFVLITFIIWFKVATDIFVIYALFYCLDYFDENEIKTISNFQQQVRTI